MNPLKILQVTNRIPWPLNDGGNLAMYHPMRCMKARGHSVTFACLNTFKHHQDPKVLAHVGPVIAEEIDTTITTGGLLKGLFSSMPYNVSRFRSEAFAKKLSDAIADNDFDIIQAEGSYLAIYGDVFSKRKNAKLILRSHNVEGVIWQRQSDAESNPLKKIYLRNLAGKISAFEKKTMHIFDGIIPISMEDEKFYQASGYQGKLRTIFGGTDTTVIFPDGRKKVPASVCFLGSLEWIPNIAAVKWFLKEIWPLVIARVPQAEFHFAGKNPGPEWQDIRQQGVFFHGEIKEPNAFLNSYEVCVLPFFSGSGMRMKSVEAMAAGLTVVSTSVGMDGIVYEKGVHAEIADTAGLFAEKIVFLLQNDGARAAMSEMARTNAVSLYDWNSLAMQLEQFYLEVL